MTMLDDARTFPWRRGCPHLPPTEYAALRKAEPVRVALASGRRAWLFSRHSDVRQMLADPAVSSDMAAPGYPLHFEAPVEVLEQLRPVMLSYDPPEHTGQRRLVTNEFTRRQVEVLRPRIRQIAEDRVDALLDAGRGADLVALVSVPAPSLVICELLGVPSADRGHFLARTRDLVAVDVAPEQRGRAQGELHEYLAGLLEGKRVEPGDDLLSRLLERNAQEDGTVLDHEGLVGMATVLLVGGHETTASMISLGVVGLLDAPDQLAVVREDPALWPSAVDELLRFFSIADLVTSRVAVRDTVVGDTLVRAGEGLIGLTAAANHDEDEFPGAASIDVRRSSRRHLAFGRGVHQCVGQNLARLELEVVLETIFRRLPGLALERPLAPADVKDDSGIFGLHELRVTW